VVLVDVEQVQLLFQVMHPIKITVMQVRDKVALGVLKVKEEKV
jgi:hypothetical protein